MSAYTAADVGYLRGIANRFDHHPDESTLRYAALTCGLVDANGMPISRLTREEAELHAYVDELDQAFRAMGYLPATDGPVPHWTPEQRAHLDRQLTLLQTYRVWCPPKVKKEQLAAELRQYAAWRPFLDEVAA